VGAFASSKSSAQERLPRGLIPALEEGFEVLEGVERNPGAVRARGVPAPAATAVAHQEEVTDFLHLELAHASLHVVVLSNVVPIVCRAQSI